MLVTHKQIPTFWCNWDFFDTGNISDKMLCLLHFLIYIFAIMSMITPIFMTHLCFCSSMNTIYYFLYYLFLHINYQFHFFSCLEAYGCLVQKMSIGNYWYLNISPIQFSLFFEETIEKWTKILLLKTRNLADQLNFNFSWIMFSLFSRSMSPYI